MKKIFLGTIFILIIVIIGWYYSIPQRIEAFLLQTPCDTPVRYHLGTVDTRFGLADNQVLSDAAQATSLWDAAEGKTLFVYDPAGSLTVSLVYDERQGLSTQISSMKQGTASEKDTLTAQIDAYQQKVAVHEQKVNDFNARVSQVNSDGGASPDVYKQLKQEQDALNTEAQQLNAEGQNLRNLAAQYNLDVSQLNQTIHTFNTDLSLKPEEGLYNPRNDTITLYFANSHDELLHTLAHEFGHSLGLEHVAGSSSIMYPYTSSSVALSLDDTTALKELCSRHVLLDRFNQNMQLLYQNLRKLIMR